MILIVSEAVKGRKRRGTFDLICFSADSAERFIDERGEIHSRHADLVWTRINENKDAQEQRIG